MQLETLGIIGIIVIIAIVVISFIYSAVKPKTQVAITEPQETSNEVTITSDFDEVDKAEESNYDYNERVNPERYDDQ